MKNPIVFIPGLMGTIGDEIIPGTGSWSFGVAGLIYNPFIKGLEDLGYRREQNLFICYYDWRKPIENIIEDSLKPIVEEVRNKFPYQPIDVIGYSMGGLVARGFLQNAKEDKNIYRLIMIGTPNKGGIDAYYLWSTGRPKRKKGLYNFIFRGYVWLLSKLIGIPMGTESINQLHEAVPSIGSLIPSIDYGSFLYYKTSNHELKSVPREFIRYTNPYLDSLNIDSRNLINRVTQIYSIIGTERNTGEGLLLDECALYCQQERIIEAIETNEGDGTVIVRSAKIDGCNNMVYEGSHHSILKKSLEVIGQLYGTTMQVEKDMEDKTLHIIFNGDTNLSLVKNDDVIMEYDKERMISKYPYVHQLSGGGYTWVVLLNLPEGEYILSSEEMKNQTEVNMLVMGDGISHDIEKKMVLSNKQKGNVMIKVTY